MKGEKDLEKLLKAMKPKHNVDDYVFCVLKDLATINIKETILIFKETEGIIIIIKKELADSLGLDYSFVAAWITLTVYSSLEAVSVIHAAFSSALAKEGISCNVIAAFYHDHIFVDKKDVEKTLNILNRFLQ